jgi:hypothetical protein
MLDQLFSFYNHDWTPQLKPLLDALSEKFGAPVRYFGIQYIHDVPDCSIYQMLEYTGVSGHAFSNLSVILYVNAQFNTMYIKDQGVVFTVEVANFINEPEVLEMVPQNLKLLQGITVPRTPSLMKYCDSICRTYSVNALSVPISIIRTDPILYAYIENKFYELLASKEANDDFIY